VLILTIPAINYAGREIFLLYVRTWLGTRCRAIARQGNRVKNRVTNR